jgi:hypothetical protein
VASGLGVAKCTGSAAVLQTAREELARKLAAIAGRRGGDGGAIQHKHGVKIVDVAKVAIECGRRQTCSTAG